jgi:hypothetical protein
MAEYEKKVRQLLLKHNCHFVRHGKGDHDIWYSPITGRNFPVDGEICIRHDFLPCATPKKSGSFDPPFVICLYSLFSLFLIPDTRLLPPQTAQAACQRHYAVLATDTRRKRLIELHIVRSRISKINPICKYIVLLPDYYIPGSTTFIVRTRDV